MSKYFGIIKSILIINLVGLYAFNGHLKAETLPPIERMTDNRDPSKIAGSYWTKSLDCTYKNPPKERILLRNTFDCQTTQHNVKVLSTWKQYFVPRSTADEEPPYCLVSQPASSFMIDEAKYRKKIYCKETIIDYIDKILK